MQTTQFMSLLPLLVCLSCSRILILFTSFNVALPLCLCPCPTSTSLSQSFPKLSYLCIISSPLSSIYINGVLLIDAKVCIWGRWLRLESCIFYGHHLIVGMTPLVDTTCNLYHLYLCRASWDTTHRIFDLDINLCDTSPYVISWVIHLIHLSSCRWGMHSLFDDHLKLRITCRTIILHDWYHV